MLPCLQVNAFLGCVNDKVLGQSLRPRHVLANITKVLVDL